MFQFLIGIAFIIYYLERSEMFDSIQYINFQINLKIFLFHSFKLVEPCTSDIMDPFLRLSHLRYIDTNIVREKRSIPICILNLFLMRRIVTALTRKRNLRKGQTQIRSLTAEPLSGKNKKYWSWILWKQQHNFFSKRTL